MNEMMTHNTCEHIAFFISMNFFTLTILLNGSKEHNIYKQESTFFLVSTT